MRLFYLSLSAFLFSFSLSIANPLKDPDLDSRPNNWVPFLKTEKLFGNQQLVLHPYAGLDKQKNSIFNINNYNDMVRENFHVGLNDEMLPYFGNNMLKPGIWMIKLYDNSTQKSIDIGVIQATFEGLQKPNVVLNILTYLNERYYKVALNSIKTVMNYLIAATRFDHFEMQALPGNQNLVKALKKLGFTKKRIEYEVYEKQF
ncbi:MAG: hypothetical protein Q8L85_07380 [Alphaproteobacteria bacterium]|nr:hypothetical protein [Alphaproteobacteria bacterium]